MKFKKFSPSKISTIVIIITALFVNLEQAFAARLELFTEGEAIQALHGRSSSYTVADVIKGVNDGILSCSKISPSGNSLIFEAFYKKNIGVVKACITQCAQRGNCLGSIDTAGRTILHAAAMSTPKLLQMVLDDLPKSHTLLNIPDSGGETPIFLAVKAFNIDNTRILKEAGADLNIEQGNSNMTSLDYVKLWLHHTTDVEHQTAVEDQKILKKIEEILSKGATEKLK